MKKQKTVLSTTYCSNGKRWEELTPEEWSIYDKEFTKAKKQAYRRENLLKDIALYLMGVNLILQGFLLILSAIARYS